MQSLKYFRHRLLITGYLKVHISGHLHGTRTITKRTSLAYSARKVQMFFWMSFKNIMFFYFFFSTLCSLLFLAAFQSPLIVAKWCWQISYFIFLLSYFCCSLVLSSLLLMILSVGIRCIFYYHRYRVRGLSLLLLKSKTRVWDIEKKNHSLYARRPFCLA